MKKITMTVNDEDYRQFKAMCVLKGYKISTRFQILIREDIKNHEVK